MGWKGWMKTLMWSELGKELCRDGDKWQPSCCSYPFRGRRRIRIDRLKIHRRTKSGNDTNPIIVDDDMSKKISTEERDKTKRKG